MTAASRGYVLDTNVVILLMRGAEAGERIDAQYGLRSSFATQFISAVTVGEALSFAKQRKWGEEKTKTLRELLQQISMIPVDGDAIFNAYVEIDAASVQQGRMMGKNDVWIAATARAANRPLLTTDKDFDHLNGLLLTREYVSPTLPETTTPQPKPPRKKRI